MKCHIADMLKRQKKHISFHTPGHKRAGADITELRYSDNLLSPSGVIKAAEKDIAKILGADKSYLLTDGSTSGIFAMLYALKQTGVKSIAVPVWSHYSVRNVCRVLGLELYEFGGEIEDGIPVQPTEEEIAEALEEADALLLLSPDYFGFFPPLEKAKELCDKANKAFVIDGAHGAHLHGEAMHASNFADMWVDGAHKSLPALTQGAVVSSNADYEKFLGRAVTHFRTSSPSYPIMASVEYAIKYPKNKKIERAANALKAEFGIKNEDWTKLVVHFGNLSYATEDYLNACGIYPEFNDGRYIMFYFSPCTKMRELKKLARVLRKLPRGDGFEPERTIRDFVHGDAWTWVPLSSSEGRTCAGECGLFPPCLPILREGDVITQGAIKRLSGRQTYGLRDGMIPVYVEE